MTLLSDVPFGTFLSGGIDSSLVTAIAAKTHSQKIDTFSLGFNEPKFDESKYAKQIADYLGTNHHQYIVSVDDVKSIILDMLDFFDEPFADSSAIPVMLISKFATQKVGVVLSGDGGDELFHGYGAYTWAKRLDKFPYKNFRNVFATILELSPSNRSKRARTFLNIKIKTL